MTHEDKDMMSCIRNDILIWGCNTYGIGRLLWRGDYSGMRVLCVSSAWELAIICDFGMWVGYSILFRHESGLYIAFIVQVIAFTAPYISSDSTYQTSSFVRRTPDYTHYILSSIYWYHLSHALLHMSILISLIVFLAPYITPDTIYHSSTCIAW